MTGVQTCALPIYSPERKSPCAVTTPQINPTPPPFAQPLTRALAPCPKTPSSTAPDKGQAGRVRVRRAEAGCQPWFSSMSVTQGEPSMEGRGPPAPAWSCRFSDQRGCSREGLQAAGTGPAPRFGRQCTAPHQARGPLLPSGLQSCRKSLLWAMFIFGVLTGWARK